MLDDPVDGLDKSTVNSSKVGLTKLELKSFMSSIGLRGNNKDNNTNKHEQQNRNSYGNQKRQSKPLNIKKGNDAANTSPPVLDYVKPENRKYNVGIVKNNDDQLLTTGGRAWYLLPIAKTDPAVVQMDADCEKQYRSEADAVYDRKLSYYQQSSGTDHSWLNSAVTSGTLADQAAALTLRIEQSPLYQLSSLVILITKLKKKVRREIYLALDTLKSLFVQYLLPDRKLIPFVKRDPSLLATTEAKDRDNILFMWCFEDKLKDCFQQFLSYVTVSMLHDISDDVRMRAVHALFDVLIEKAEDEKIILTALVNKLGDTSAKVAARVSLLLTKTLQSHPNMKSIVAGEVERLVYRPNISKRAQYYAICFLGSIQLRPIDSELAVRLIKVYFGLFKLLIAEEDGYNQKMLSALLRGANSAFPFAKEKMDLLTEEINTLYNVAGKSQLRTSLQALHLLFQVLDSSASVSDRFYGALYRILHDDSLTESHVALPLFFNLILKVILNDGVESRARAFLRRLLQICLIAQPSFVCASLMVCSEIVTEKATLLSTQMRPGIEVTNITEPGTSTDDRFDDDDEDEHFVDVDDNRNADIKPATGSWVFRTKATKVISNVSKNPNGIYDPFARNPLGANATAAMPELVLLSRHYHPSVRSFVQSVLMEQPIEYSGIPLQDFTLIKFLDRFVFKNAKSKSKTAGMNVQVAVNSSEFVSKNEREVPVSDLFMHRYMKGLANPLIDNKKQVDRDEDMESVNSDEFEAIHDQCFEPGVEKESFLVDFGRELKHNKQAMPGRKRKQIVQDDDEVDSDGGDETILEDVVGKKSAKQNKWQKRQDQLVNNDWKKRKQSVRGKK